jgi:ribonuclease D
MSFQDGHIETAEDLLRLRDELRGQEVIAVDMESNGFFRYPESICLIQIGFAGRQFLVDTVVLKDIDPILAILADRKRLCLLHSCSYDVSSFKRDYDCEFGRIFDTSIAAAFLGLDRLGLDAVLKETLGVDIPKDKSLQRCDWTTRPLSPKQVAYAKSDVEFLVDLHLEQSRRLMELGRLDWVEEECEIAKSIPYTPPPPPEKAFLKGKRVNTLSPRGKAIYKEIFLYRDEKALKRGTAPFRIFHNDLILKVASHCAATGHPPDRSINLPRAHIEGVNAAVRRGLAAQPFISERHPPRKPALNSRQKELLNALKETRTKLGERLNLDPSLLWRSSNLFDLAVCESRAEAERTFVNSDLRKWQLDNFKNDFLRHFDD